MGSFIRYQVAPFPSLQRLEVSAPNAVVNYLPSGEPADFFENLQSHCPRLDWLDVNLRIRVHIDDNGYMAPLKIHWPEERQPLRIVYHQHQPEEDERVRWLEPWRHFEGNVRVVDDAEEIRESQKEAEKQWIVSPYQFFA